MTQTICDRCGNPCKRGTERHCMQCGEDACEQCAPDVYGDPCICDKCKAENAERARKHEST